jgi:hypothetical protein
MRNSFNKVQYLLFALLLFALTGCGASGTQATAVTGPANGKITANVVMPKSAGKTAALASSADVTNISLMVTGADIPTVKADFSPTDLNKTLEVYPGSHLTVAAYAYNGTELIFEGFATEVTVAAGPNTEVTILLNAAVAKVEDKPCLSCHADTRDTDGQNLVASYKQSGHYKNTTTDATLIFPANGSLQAGCAGCHGTGHQDLNPAASGRCAVCHTVGGVMANLNHVAYTNGAVNTCGSCHVTHNTKGGSGCIGCHSIGQNAGVAYVQDNNGVRAITGEFAKRSHHVTGRAVTNTDCVACHLEGIASGTAVVVDPNFHMKDAKIYLRNGNPGLLLNQDKSVAGAYPWNPAAPDHTLMDQFCFSCHNAGGAPAAVTALTGVAGYKGTALNPFDDSVSNAYDQVSRVSVVNAFDQFDTNNSSHHAVRGKKYLTKNLTAAQFTNISTANYNFNELGVNKPIKGVVSAVDISGNKIVGTMFETSKFVDTYTTLNGAALADNNTLHCGDCHTVGQFRASDVNVAPFNKAVIGAHGSNNEYLLRNKNGDDVFNKDALVCYICHKEQFYNSDTYNGTDGATKITNGIRHAGVNTSWDCNGQVLNSAGKTGLARLQMREDEEATPESIAANLALIAAGKYTSTSGSPIFGFSCANCHNASDKKTFGGIHGNAGNATYKTYSGAKNVVGDGSTVVDRKPYRFLPGLGNFRFNGGDNTDAWTVKTISTANKQGCYTLNGASSAAGIANIVPTKAVLSGVNVSAKALADDNGILGSWGACTDHAGTTIAGGRAVTRTILRPLTY